MDYLLEKNSKEKDAWIDYVFTKALLLSRSDEQTIHSFANMELVHPEMKVYLKNYEGGSAVLDELGFYEEAFIAGHGLEGLTPGFADLKEKIRKALCRVLNELPPGEVNRHIILSKIIPELIQCLPDGITKAIEALIISLLSLLMKSGRKKICG